MRLRPEIKNFTDSFAGQLGQQAAARPTFLGRAFTNTLDANGFGKVLGLARDLLINIPGKIIGSVAKWTFIGSAGASAAVGVGSAAVGVGAVAGTAHVAKQPIAGALHIGAGVVRSARRHPVVTGVLAAGTGLYALTSWLTGRAARSTQTSLMADAADAADAQVEAMVAAQAVESPQIYKNVVSHAAVDQRLAADRAAGVAPAGQVAAINAARQQVPAPEAARA
jgi:hypothetical protein